MNIERAKRLKVGDSVACPCDRGDLAFTGKVTHISKLVYATCKGREYMWIEVQGPKYKSVWPSNRLG